MREKEREEDWRERKNEEKDEGQKKGLGRRKEKQNGREGGVMNDGPMW